MPSNIADVQNAGYLSVWPDNPYNNWEPMAIKYFGEDFSPGDLCIQVCPYEYYSYGDRGFIPFSFALSIWGSSVEIGETYGCHSEPYSENGDWLLLPDGALYSSNVHLSSSLALRELYNRVEEEE